MFRTLLIANRGEICCRVAATARRLGLRTVAVYSDADAASAHVAACDQAIRVGGPASADSYLRIDRIIAAARASDAEAIHPGYGFLSEHAAFATACEDAGLIFVGPPAHAIQAMGDKRQAKQLMRAASVPLIPGYDGGDDSAATLQAQAARIGFPVLIKAALGGGGRGIRVVAAPGEFESALASCKREALAAFGDDRVLLERYVSNPRHIEIQVFADRHGGCVWLGERDCSAQRRHQKVIEESPAPGLAPDQRLQLGRAAVTAAQAVGYVGAGTVEFLLAPDGEFYFMEMNTRLQVEHPVTEMVTGLDLVEWQLRVAAGEPLPLRQDQVQVRGPELPFDQIQAGHHFSDGVLDLQPRVHLHEVELAVRREQELHRAGTDVSDRLRRGHRGPPQLQALLGRKTRGRRLFDHLLVAALGRAVALSQPQTAAVPVREHLDLDVARVRHVALQQHAIVAESRQRFALARGQRRLELARCRHDPDAAPTPAQRCLDQHRKTDARGLCLQC